MFVCQFDFVISEAFVKAECQTRLGSSLLDLHLLRLGFLSFFRSIRGVYRNLTIFEHFRIVIGHRYNSRRILPVMIGIAHRLISPNRR